jgi:hypothetical protein
MDRVLYIPGGPSGARAGGPGDADTRRRDWADARAAWRRSISICCGVAGRTAVGARAGNTWKEGEACRAGETGGGRRDRIWSIRVEVRVAEKAASWAVVTNGAVGEDGAVGVSTDTMAERLGFLILYKMEAVEVGGDEADASEDNMDSVSGDACTAESPLGRQEG